MSDYIPFEIQAHIMKRLPAKSLMQFRTVSKSYKSLIDSSEFIAEYSFDQSHLLVSYFERRSHEYKHVSILDDNTFPQEKFSLPNPLSKPVWGYLRKPRILGSSQGLFWLYCIIRNPSGPYTLITKSVLWNPSIRKSVIVEALDHKDGLFGFGVCPVTRDPKVVRIGFGHSVFEDTIYSTPWHVDVYTLSSGAWRSIPTITQPRNSVLLSAQHVVTDDFIYWRAIDGFIRNQMTREFKSRYNMIVSFDLTNEIFMEVSLPDTLASADSGNVFISKLKDSLVVLEVLRQAEKQSYVVWTMEHGVPNTFTKLFTINLQDASIHGVFGFRKGNEPIFDMTIFKNEDSVIVQGLNSEHMNDFSIQQFQSEHINCADFSIQQFQSEHINCAGISGNGPSFLALSYMETLLLLDH